MEKLIVVKIGGNVIDSDAALDKFLVAYSQISGKKILVHGGGKIATAIGEKLGISSKYIAGRRITDDHTIDLVTMVYGGLVNKKIVAKLQGLGVNALGVTGADANLIPAVKRPVKDIDFGWVGDLSGELNLETWNLFLDNGIQPVVSPLTHDQKGKMLNTNADTIASAIAVALSGVYDVDLIYCFEKNGVLRLIEDENSVISILNAAGYEELKKSGSLFAGILPKIDNSFAAVQQGVKQVIIGNSLDLRELAGGTKGTKIWR